MCLLRLRRLRRPAPTFADRLPWMPDELHALSDRYPASNCTTQSAGCACASRARGQAYQAARQLAADQLADLADLVESLESVYAIAIKLDQIDEAFLAASDESLKSALVYNWSWAASWKSHLAADGQESRDTAHLREQVDKQDVALSAWVAEQSPAKRRWAEELLALRRQVADACLKGHGNVQALRQELAFRRGVLAAQGLPLVAGDVENDLLTSAQAAETARALSQAVVELELPAPQALPQPS